MEQFLELNSMEKRSKSENGRVASLKIIPITYMFQNKIADNIERMSEIIYNGQIPADSADTRASLRGTVDPRYLDFGYLE